MLHAGTVDVILSLVDGAMPRRKADDTMAKEFKSERAAKMAYTKAAKVWRELPGGTQVYRESMEDPTCDDPQARARAADETRDAAFERMREIYEQAKAQGFWIDSWHFGHNPTRDLIAANMD